MSRLGARSRPMAENSKIEWCDHTFNPWQGCAAVSPACDRCYAKALVKRYGGDFSQRRRTSPANWKKPLAWNRKAAAEGVRAKVFCSSLADVFDNQVPNAWRRDLWKLIWNTPSLDWLLLTKRPQNIAKMLPANYDPPERTPAWPWPHVSLGATVENQAEADRRIPHLLAIPAAVHFLSCEPLLGPIDLTKIDINGDAEMDALHPASWREIWDDCWSPAATGLPLEQCVLDFVDEGGVYPPTDDRPRGIDWVICGGESGPNRRRVNLDHMRSLRDQCAAAGVAFFGKQDDKKTPLPDDLMVRQFPESAETADE